MTQVLDRFQELTDVEMFEVEGGYGSRGDSSSSSGGGSSSGSSSGTSVAEAAEGIGDGMTGAGATMTLWSVKTGNVPGAKAGAALTAAGWATSTVAGAFTD